MNVTILGCGAYGLALASIIDNNKHNITMWTNSLEEYKILTTEKTYQDRLPNYNISKNIKFTIDIIESIKNVDLLVIAVPAKYLSDVLRQIKNDLSKSTHILIATKGIEQNTCRLCHDILLDNIKTSKYAIISGPSFAHDIILKEPIGLSLATKNKDTESIVKKALENNYIKLRTTKDIVGVEICGSIKNVIAIASGILDGMNVSSSTKAMLITEALNDIKNLIYALGGSKKTILSFAGFGDLLLTSTSEKSRNFQLGQMIGQSKNENEIKEYLEMTTVEGFYTLTSIKKLIKKKQIKMPIINLIYDIILNKKEKEELLKFLIQKD